MGETTAISWCRHTFNPWMGCQKVSPACDGCYAEALMDKRYGKVKWGPHGERVRTSPGNWHQPIRWNKAAAAAGERPFVFCASLADVFDNKVPTAWRTDLFELIHATPNLVWLLLTKRPQNIVKMFDEACGASASFPPNVALGTTVEDQQRADINVPHLVAAKAALGPAFAFLSCEPLLGPIDLTPWLARVHHHPDNRHSAALDALVLAAGDALGRDGPDWVITGGETDQGEHKARPTHPDWFRSLRDQCAAAGVAYHHKQNGEWVSVSEVAGEGTHHRFEDGATVRRIGKGRTGRTIDGVEHNALPTVPA